ncbi:L-carnitine dehydrogenase-like isoform X2 [Branchiostoma floridae]|uniref:L-carnitine dehydrogenase-like isoform X2 n=1 Tax=Branchiostoma floridae TaxID=7739 RepID=A0A9J7M744_BRAFL|nr:L-carnitine dehydrogenase-like isoform X2 [Branchiostoma floridae]
MNGGCSSDVRTDTGVPDERIKIAVIGCGLLGTRIAGELCLCGCAVAMYDSDNTALSTAVSRIHQDWEHLRTQGLLLNQHPQANNLICASSLEAAVEGAQFVLEAVVEDLQVKSDLMRRISSTCSQTAVLGTNTLTLDITAISEHVLHKQRLIGIRFLYPVYTIPEVEVTMGGNTDAQVLQRVGRLIEHLGKVLFVRTGDPLILTPQQVQSRQIAWKEKVQAQQRDRGPGSHGGLNASSHAVVSMLQHVHSATNYRTETEDNRHTDSSPRGNECIICTERERNCLLSPCNHLCCCMECAKSLTNRHQNCPMCRTPIAEVLRVFIVGQTVPTTSAMATT